MANYITKIGDAEIRLEAPVGGAFSKSDSGERPDPEKAIQTMFNYIGLVAEAAGTQLAPKLRNSGASFELSFACRADNTGLVMVSERADNGQFVCSIKFPAMRPAPPQPRPAIPQRSQD